MNTMKTLAAAAVLGAALLGGGAAEALPAFTAGTLAIGAFTNTNTNLGSTTVFTLDAPFASSIILSGPFGSFALPPISPELVSVGSTLDLGNPSTFSFNDGGAVGQFVATTVSGITFTSTPVAGGSSNVLSFRVDGLYTIGNAFSNAGAMLSADETFSLTQTLNPGATNGSISISGTFQSPAAPPPTVPEPASLAVLGAGLAGLGLLRKRKAK